MWCHFNRKIWTDSHVTDPYKKIADVYYTPSATGSFQGSVKLYQSLRKECVNIALADVTRWLNRQDVYTMNRMAPPKA